MTAPIVFSTDADIRGQLEGRLVTEGTSECVCTDSPEAALERLQEQSRPLLLIDVLSDGDHSITAELQSLLLERRVPALNVVTFGNGSLPRPVAALSDLLSVHHSVVDRGVLDALQSDDRLADIAAQSCPRPMPEFRRVEAGGVHFTTYTPSFFSVIDDLLRVAHRDVTLLIVGETGTGKTTLARFIHQRSSRRDRPFQNLACGALPSDLIESELFGHVRGAFTGADRNKIGRFEAAGRGTLLLDEIDVLDPKQQAKLLKVIETGEYEMVGSTESRHSEARLIVAANVNLEELMRKSQFRSDLYYRLNVLEFRLPPLRDRQPDIVPLAMEFVDEFCEEHEIVVRRISREFLRALQEHRWSGNLRELKNHIRRAVLFCENEELTVSDLADSVVCAEGRTNGHAKSTEPGWTLADRIANSEREMLVQALKANGNNRTRTAKALGISRVGLYKKLRRLGLAEERQKAEST
ncbi:MAG: sigma-54-dependent Fis family transcriptional regulator [Planctomycetota bacterium]|nr:MAG: sigma-54-dependent Fis family transcriptional regulator [Planctomycetota bacterium]